MPWLLIFLAGILLGAGVVWWQQKRKSTPVVDIDLATECRRLEKELCEWEEQANAFADYNDRQQAVRETRKQAIVSWLREGGRLQSGEIADRYDISTRTVRRYMTELVEAGLVTQSDEIGRGVFYQIVEK